MFTPFDAKKRENTLFQNRRYQVALSSSVIKYVIKLSIKGNSHPKALLKTAKIIMNGQTDSAQKNDDFTFLKKKKRTDKK